MNNKFIEQQFLFIIIAIMLTAQYILNFNLPLGQGLLLLANGCFLYRDFKLQRPAADKIKNLIFSIMSGVCLGLAVVG